MQVTIRWQAWHGDTQAQLDFPSGWRVSVAPMADAPAANGDVVLRALRNPIGAPPLTELAQGKQTAVIVVEDITRPLPTAAILPTLFAELETAGVKQVWITMGLGAHTPMNRPDLIKKLGQRVVDHYAVYQNQPYENLAYLGQSERGTPIYISRFFLDAELRISLGTITPHAYAGFGAGAKTVAVGVAGIETLHANHGRALFSGPKTDRVEPADNPCRADMEEIARTAGLHFIVNGVVNSRREIAGLFAGDMIQAHRAGVALARRVYATELPPPADVVIFNAYPKDTNQLQSVNALNAAGYDIARVLKPNGTGVLAAACSDGAGINYLESYGMRGHLQLTREMMGLGEHGMMIYSPNLAFPEVQHLYPSDTRVLNRWEQVVDELVRRHGDRATATVFPNGATQIPAGGLT